MKEKGITLNDKLYFPRKKKSNLDLDLFEDMENYLRGKLLCGGDIQRYQ